MTAVYGSQSTPRVLMAVSTLKAKHQTLFFLQWLLQRSTKKRNHSNNTNNEMHFSDRLPFFSGRKCRSPFVRFVRIIDQP